MNNFNSSDFSFSRRRFVTGTLAAGGLVGLGINPLELHAYTDSSSGLVPELTGNRFNLDIGYQRVNFTGKTAMGNAINGSVPGPTLRFKQGETVTLNVKNNLGEDSSIHWHGMILPNEMDGVPGLTFDGIKPGNTYQYQFDVKQNGTYWYHSHSGFQEQQGVYGAIVIDPIEPEPFSYDRDYVVLLSDWSDEDPNRMYRKLKKLNDYYSAKERTFADTWNEVKEKGVSGAFNSRKMWNQQRMSDNDLSDVTGLTYTYLMNGQNPEGNWKSLFKRGEKVRLRFINASAMSIFDVRIPGLDMTVVAADGQHVEPVTIDEFRINVAETFDVIVAPKDNSAYTVFCQTIDRSGYALGTLTPDLALNAEVPAMDRRATLTHGDMGMGGMDHSKMDMGGGSMGGMDHSKMDMGGGGSMAGMDHSKMNMGSMSSQRMQVKSDKVGNIAKAGQGSETAINHLRTEFGPQVDMRAETPVSGIADPGIGLRNNGRRVLSYADLFNLYDTSDAPEPTREIQVHLTGNMSRYMWSMNGVKFNDADPIKLKFGERVRFHLVNDTMMTHPIHLHGVWSDLETGDAKRIPRKHTITVQPGSTVSYLVSADARGNWAYHCHLLFHMKAGMFRNVQIS